MASYAPVSRASAHPGRRLYRQLRATVDDFQLIAPGDRILVAVSGGKDSATLLLLLRQLRAARRDFELIAVHLDQVQPGYDGAPLRDWLRSLDVRFEILREDTYSEVIEKTAAGGTYCSICSRLRRGILYTAAQRLGCTKLALGHHRDDALETLLMNLFFSGALGAMPATYESEPGKLDVIRPLIECAEVDIASYAAEQGVPILPCNLCGSQDGLQRERMAQLIAELEREHPDVRSVMLAALKNVRAGWLLDRGLRREDGGRSGVAGAAPRYRALPVVSG